MPTKLEYYRLTVMGKQAYETGNFRAIARILFQPRQRGKPWVWGRSPQRGPGTEPLVRASEAKSPWSSKLLSSWMPREIENLLQFLGDCLQNGSQSPHFLAHVCCGQTAGWMKTPLDTKVDLGPGHTVLDGHPAPTPREGHSSAPFSFRPMSVLATVAHLSYWWALVLFYDLFIIHQNVLSCIYTTMLWWSVIFGRLFVKQFALCYQTFVCLSVLSVFDVGVLWPNGWMD